MPGNPLCPFGEVAVKIALERKSSRSLFGRPRASLSLSSFARDSSSEGVNSLDDDVGICAHSVLSSVSGPP